jgi:hypothetical protein
MRLLLIIGFLFIGCFIGMPQSNEPPKKDYAAISRALRMKMLSTKPADLGLKPNPEFPHVSGLVMDWPIESTTVTLVAHATGDASIYTTGTFGVIGGIGHESVRTSATNCIKVAQSFYSSATPTKDFPYPQPGRVRFYLICYDEVRVIDADLNGLKNKTDNSLNLFMAAQDVITELRLITKDKIQKKH